MKYLIWVAIAAIVWWVWSKRKAAERRQQAEVTPPPRAAERMVRCATCGVHLPESDALQHAGQHYCSPAHRDQAGSRD